MTNIGKLRNMTAIYLLQNDKILLLHRKGSKVVDNLWVGSAGGHFKPDELNDAKACVLREMKEELSVTEDMLLNFSLRYITLRKTNGEIRQNYYFFANLKDDISTEFSSNEGDLKWFEYDELSKVEMPLSAKYMINHYIDIGRYNDKMYVGTTCSEKMIFTELLET